jgi:hypothetical protein
VPVSHSIDLPVLIFLPDDQRVKISGHQYTPERLRIEGQALAPSHLYASSNFRHEQPVLFQDCSTQDVVWREEISVQFSRMRRDSVPYVRVTFLKSLFDEHNEELGPTDGRRVAAGPDHAEPRSDLRETAVTGNQRLKRLLTCIVLFEGTAYRAR